MKEIIAIINQKGGVGKSTTVHAVGAGLVLKGFRVLYIDLDAQGNLSDTLKADTKNLTVLEVLEGRVTAGEAVIKYGDGGGIVPSSPALSGADTILAAVGKEYRLKEALEPLENEYDYIIIDTPPALGVLTVNALTACTQAVIPAQADVYSLQGINQLYTTIDTVRKYCNRSLKIKGILLTRYNPRTVLGRDISEVIDETAKKFNTKLFRASVREAIAVKEAQARRQDIFSYAPGSNAAADYLAVIDELLAE